MDHIKAFLKKKDIAFTLQRYGIDALGAMAQGLFCTLLVGTILNTIGQQFGISFLNQVIVTIGSGEGVANYTIGGLASALVGPGIAVSIGFALRCPNLVLFSLIPVGFAANSMGGAGSRGLREYQSRASWLCTDPSPTRDREAGGGSQSLKGAISAPERHPL